MTAISRFAVAFALGIGLGLRLGDDRVALACLLAAPLMGVLAALHGAGRARVAAVALAGALNGALAAEAARTDCRARVPDGTRVEAGVHFREPPAPGRVVDVSLESLVAAGRPIACAGAVRVRLPAAADVEGASHARITGVWWSDPVPGGWPVPPERRGMLAARTVVASKAPGHGHPVTRLRFSAVLTARAVFDRERPLAESLLLARRDDLDPEVRQQFAAAGLAHMLAISGAHVGILAGAMLMVLRMLGASARLAPAGAAFATVAYVAFLGAPSAAARAALQALLLLASRALQRPADPLSLIAGAAMTLLAARPLSLLDPGFQLSFTGVFALVAFREPLAVLLPERLPRSIRQATAATLAASLATAPIAAWHFGIVSLIGPLANLLAAPIISAALPASALALVLGVVHRGAGAFLGTGAGVLLGGLRVVAHTAARPAWGHVWVTSFGVTAALLGAVAALRLAPAPAVRPGLDPRARRRALRSRLLARSGAAAAVASLVLAVGPGGRGALEIHVIDVGQGDAIAIRTPRARWILIDTGPRTATFDAGRMRVAPYLLERGARRLEALILTHPDADHVGGAQWLWRAFDIRVVIDPAVPTGKDVYMDAMRAARERGTPWLAAREGREVRIDDVGIRILAPSDSFLDRPHESNDLSVVARLEYGSFGALLLGDAPTSVEDALVARYGPAMRAQLIKVGHHGSRTSTGDSLLAAARPVLALIPVGRRNRYGHPAPDVVRRLELHGVRILRTDDGGSIEVRVRPGAPLEVRRRP
jgi:competence protein ComEC